MPGAPSNHSVSNRIFHHPGTQCLINVTMSALDSIEWALVPPEFGSHATQVSAGRVAPRSATSPDRTIVGNSTTLSLGAVSSRR